MKKYNDKKQLIKLLCRCHAVKSSRNGIVNQLSKVQDGYITQCIRTGSSDLDFVNDIVERCSHFSIGIEKLVQAVRLYEGDSTPMLKVYEAMVPLLVSFDSTTIPTEDWLELVEISFQPELPDDKELQNCYQSSLPDFEKPLKRDLTFWRCINHLVDIHSSSGELPLFYFIRLIAEKTKKDNISKRLKDWVDQAREKLQSKSVEITEKPIDSDVGVRSSPIYLLVHIRHDLNNPANRLQKFYVHIYKWRSSKFCSYIYNSKEPVEPNNFFKIIYDVIESEFDEDYDDIRFIEFFLPHDCLHLNVDEWTRKEKETELETRLVEDYKIIVRLDRYRYKSGKKVHRHIIKKWKDKWNILQLLQRRSTDDEFIPWINKISKHIIKKCKDKWNILQSFQKKGAGDKFMRWINQNDYDDINIDLINSEIRAGKTCLLMTMLPQKADKLGNLILNCGIPAAVWCKKAAHQIEDPNLIKQEIMKLVKEENLLDLRERVHSIVEEPEHLKKTKLHLRLLWDNPNRIPRGIKGTDFLRTPTEREKK